MSAGKDDKDFSDARWRTTTEHKSERALDEKSGALFNFCLSLFAFVTIFERFVLLVAFGTCGNVTTVKG